MPPHLLVDEHSPLGFLQNTRELFLAMAFRSEVRMVCSRPAVALAIRPFAFRMDVKYAIQLWLGRAFPGLDAVLFSLATAADPAA